MHLCGLSYAARRKRDKNYFTEAREERKGKDRLLSYRVLSRVFAFFAAFCSVFIQKQKNGSCSATSLIEEQFGDNHKVKRSKKRWKTNGVKLGGMASGLWVPQVGANNVHASRILDATNVSSTSQRFGRGLLTITARAVFS